jgi:hypothetical protein
VDCVKYRVFCQREKVDREPLIRLYQALPPAAPLTPPSQEGFKPLGDGSSVTDGDTTAVAKAAAAVAATKKRKEAAKEKVKFVRRGVADWKGVLVAYEVVEWFKGLQQG